MSEAGGPASQIAMLGATFSGAYWIDITDVLPGAGAALVAVWSRSFSADYADIFLVTLDTLATKLLIQYGYGARYVSSGHIVFARAGTLLAVPFDESRLEVSGQPALVQDGVGMESLFGQAQFAVSDNGVLVYVPGGDEAVGKIAWVDREGAVEFLSVPEQIYGAADIARDGKRLAIHVGDVNDYIWIYDLERKEGRRLVSGSFPVWSPDSDAIAFSSVEPDGRWKMLVQPVDRAEQPRELWTTNGLAAASTWSFDRRTIGVYHESDPYFMGFLSTGAEPDFETVSNEGATHLFPTFSPDGRYVAYGSDESGRFEIWARSFPDGRTVRQISVNGGVEPVWCETGELFFRAGD